jgi:hypothetical protein
MDFNLDGIKGAPDIYVEVHDSFIAGKVITPHEKHFFRLHALERKLKAVGIDALHRDGHMTVNTKAFDRAQVLDRIAEGFRADGLEVECWRIGCRNDDRTKIDSFVKLAAVEVVITMGEFIGLTQELKAAVAAVAEPQKKELLAVLKKLDLYQKKNR